MGTSILEENPTFQVAQLFLWRTLILFVISRRTAVSLIMLMITGATQLCWAHAILMESTPKLNATVSGPELDVTMRFNVRIDGGRSRVVLIAPDGTSSPLALAKQAKPDILQCHATGLKPGTYRLQWNVLASDGHMSKGDIPFTVK
jgi:methionine-rich copper-binding protein CopC